MLKVFCEQIRDVNFSNEIPSSISENEVYVFLGDVNSSKHLFEKASQILSLDELEKANRFHFEKDRNLFLASHILLRKILGNYLKFPANEILFKEDSNKKPYIKLPESELHFNLSHSANNFLISISNSETGVDIETVKKDFDFNSVTKKYFSDKELSDIFKNPNNSRQKFYSYWTKKEALLKYFGTGIEDKLLNIDLSSQINFVKDLNISESEIQLKTFSVNSCCASVAFSTNVNSLKMFSLNLLP